jgi:DnaJ-class molecular chaperone
MKRGRPTTDNTARLSHCSVCEGTQFHQGVSCPACNGSGKEKVRKQLQKVYNAENGLPINHGIKEM